MSFSKAHLSSSEFTISESRRPRSASSSSSCREKRASSSTLSLLGNFSNNDLIWDFFEEMDIMLSKAAFAFSFWSTIMFPCSIDPCKSFISLSISAASLAFLFTLASFCFMAFVGGSYKVYKDLSGKSERKQYQR